MDSTLLHRQLPGFHPSSANPQRNPKFSVATKSTSVKINETLKSKRLNCSNSSSLSSESPSRPVVILPGLGNNSKDYDALVYSLKQRGFSTEVVEISRPDWLRNALGLLDRSYWTGKLTPRPVLDWYFERMQKAIENAKNASEGNMKVTLIGHSAGGWLARVYMSEFGIDDIGLLLSLGTPHLPPPKGLPGVIDQTRGLLDYVNNVCPGNFFAPDVEYICIAGRYLKGERIVSEKVPVTPAAEVSNETVAFRQQVNTLADFPILEPEDDGKSTERGSTLQARIVGQGYKQVCGQADVWGDGVVPEISAHLEGAKNITLDGVYHSPVGARSPDRPWYGSPEILEQWVHYLQ